MPKSISFARPADLHVHFRDGEMLAAVVPYTARAFGRATVMPNLVPPVTTAAECAAYRRRIQAAVPAEADFVPLMTCYLTDDTDADDLLAGHRDGVVTAAKLYPAHATTNSAHGVTAIEQLDGVFGRMAEAGVPLLVHGEYVADDVDIFDRETVFLDRVLAPLLGRVPGLKIVLEHVTTEQGVDFVRAHPGRVGATITPQHLLYNRNALFAGGLRPHLYCLPILKRARHQAALRRAATSGDPGFFLGTDSAPHPTRRKEADCGCAGVFSAPVAVAAYLKVFDEEGALDRFERFAALNGPAFYGLLPETRRVTYARTATAVPTDVAVGDDVVRPLFAGETVDWHEVVPR